MSKSNKKETEQCTLHSVVRSTLEQKEATYKMACEWFEKEYDSSSDEDTVREWEDKCKELNAQINMLRHLLMETKQYVA